MRRAPTGAGGHWTAGALLVGALVSTLAARALFFAGPHQEPNGRVPDPIVDIHVHAAGLGIGSDCYISPALRESYKFGYYLDGFGVTAADLEREGDALVIRRIAEWVAASEHVDRAIVLALDGVVDAAGELDLERTQVYVPTEFVATETARYEQLWLGASVNPLRRDALERLARAKASGARLVKWIPSIQLFDPADPRLEPFYRKLVELELPLLTHAGRERSFAAARDELADPARLRLPLELGVTVIVAHIASTGENAGERDTDRLRAMLVEFPNLLTDVSSLTQANRLGYLREALTRPEFEGRLLYGSDFPLVNTPLVSPWFFPMNLSLGQMRALSAIANPWDRDVALKRELGLSAEIFGRANGLFPAVSHLAATSRPDGSPARPGSLRGDPGR